MEIIGYRAMWLFVAFDLPTQTKRQRKDYARFRKELKKDGFWMLQFSFYVRPCPSEETLHLHEGRIRAQLPPSGQVRIFKITDKQYGMMRIFYGEKEFLPEKMPDQLLLF